MLIFVAIVTSAILAALVFMFVDEVIVTPRARQKNQDRRDVKSISSAIEELTRHTTFLMQQTLRNPPTE